jgi:protoporphyrin/coproporphyrin ferrochelatase
MTYDAVLLLGFGGPEGPAEVVPFLERVTAGRGIPAERLVEVGQHYFTLGGVSPINAQNRALRDALSAELAATGQQIEVVLANRNSAPFVADVLADLSSRGVRAALGVATAAYSGYSGCRQYREDLGLALASTGVAVELRKLPPYVDLPGFAGAMAELLLAALPSEVNLADPGTRLVFTTHSIPVSVAAASGPTGHAYVAQHRWVAGQIAQLIAEATGVTKTWDLVFQSRSGQPTMPWLEPDVNDALAEYAAADARDIILVPIGFLSDHVEVIWDLDTQAAQTAKDLGLRLIRTPTVGTHARFVADLAQRIVTALDAGLTDAVDGDLCHGDCCLNPRSQAPVVPGCASICGEAR